jgi:hypothetical protein
MSGAETVKGSTPAPLSLGVVGGGEFTGATDFYGALVGVVDDVGSTTALLSLAVPRFAQNCLQMKRIQHKRSKWAILWEYMIEYFVHFLAIGSA